MQAQVQKVFFCLLAILPLRDYAQLDTLVISQIGFANCDPKIAKMALDSAHIFYIDLDPFPPANPSGNRLDKKSRKLLSRTVDILDKKLGEVKVVYILNPTGGLFQEADTNLCSIYKLHFEKMTSLQTIYLIGDDMDNISLMPATFYKTPARKVYCFNCFHPDSLEAEIHKKRKDIEVVSAIIKSPDDKEMKLLRLL